MDIPEDKFKELAEYNLLVIADWLFKNRQLSSALNKKFKANLHILTQFLMCNSGAELYLQYILMAAQLNLTYADFAILAIASCATLWHSTINKENTIFNYNAVIELIDDENNNLDFVFKNPDVVVKMIRYAKHGPRNIDRQALLKICAHVLKRYPDIKKMNCFFAVSRKNIYATSKNSKVRIPLMSDEEIENYL